ncbi:glucose-1-phosphate adenylyltransferase [Paenibacillus sp. HN-1]|uniref:glucose-1-phosphate adenylyltransferase n=1 Tax=Paenibacillus TaxID=44249 RepID=UPI001CA9505B|nr:MULTISPECIES: glucose-1-phosphate adenylyltransferase [Paenibacillus]MBY9082081.1 glucose-1-phosphate adenylyltransferase [Paenibacillus sp. CGMCC 1.18879]MBY9085761.1 glucose-1-phosphate adenylyltransferase [Paenibacillus sinensis]
MSKKDCIAMLLAGGEGRRLAPLTSGMAKPAVPFGGHYRIIDFPLSNCVNSGIDTVGVLTQYAAESLHSHIGEGEPWGLRTEADKGIALLPSGTEQKGSYAGTADAIYKNINYIDSLDPEHVLILSGDHIYHMDYRQMLEYHQQTDANATISVMEVPWEQASRFGVMNVNEKLQITDFVEKPPKPLSNLASMGIYLFRWSYLKSHLLEDAACSASSHDFGKDVIPAMLRSDDSLFAYRFKGYWRDVGTVESLWEAHMDLLAGDNDWGLDISQWPMYSRKLVTRPAAIRCKAQGSSHNALISELASIEGVVKRSVVFANVEIGKSSTVKNSVIMPGARIGKSVYIENAIIGEDAVIMDGTVVTGSVDTITVIGPRETVAPKPVIRTQPSRLFQEVYENTSRLRAGGLLS